MRPRALHAAEESDYDGFQIGLERQPDWAVMVGAQTAKKGLERGIFFLMRKSPRISHVEALEIPKLDTS